jgi:hypothetical protein
MSDDEMEMNTVAVQEQTADDAPSSGGGGTNPADVVAGTKAWAQVAKGFAYVEISSLVLMFACIGMWDKNYWYYSELCYALSVSVISLAACLIIQTGEFVKPGLLEKIEKPVSLFLFVWWGIGTGVITFRAPFTTTSNGFFAAWAGFLFTTKWALNIDSSQYTELEKGRKHLFLLFACGLLELFSTIHPISIGMNKGEAAWGMTAGILTIIITGVLFKAYDDIAISIMKVTSAFLFCMWATVAGGKTFDQSVRFKPNIFASY